MLKKLIEEVTVGDVISIEENENPYTKKKEFFTITIIEKTTCDGFYFFKVGSPNNRNVIQHSNIFVWGISSYKIQQHIDFEKRSFGGFEWVVFNSDLDLEFSNYGQKAQCFKKFAPENIKEIYNGNEENNDHYGNQLLISKFLEYLLKGNEPSSFKYKN